MSARHKLIIAALGLGWASTGAAYFCITHRKPTVPAFVSIFGATISTTILYYASTGPQLYSPGLASRSIGTLLNSTALIMASQAMVAKRSLPKPGQGLSSEQIIEEYYSAPVQGIERVTRHPLLVAAGICGLANCLRRGNLGSLVFWAPFPVFSLILGAKLDNIPKHNGPRSKEFYNQTSLLPFKAILEGRNSFAKFIEEFSYGHAAASLVVGLLIKYPSIFWTALGISRATSAGKDDDEDSPSNDAFYHSYVTSAIITSDTGDDSGGDEESERQ